jgi:hypothetical protein
MREKWTIRLATLQEEKKEPRTKEIRLRNIFFANAKRSELTTLTVLLWLFSESFTDATTWRNVGEFLFEYASLPQSTSSEKAKRQRDCAQSPENPAASHPNFQLPPHQYCGPVRCKIIRKPWMPPRLDITSSRDIAPIPAPSYGAPPEDMGPLVDFPRRGYLARETPSPFACSQT